MAFLRVCALVGPWLLVAACTNHDSLAEGDWTPSPAPDLGPVVARVGDVSIFALQVKARAMRLGLSAQEALEELVDLHALAERARSKPRRQPADSGVQGAMVQRFLEREFETTARPQDVPEQDIRRLYEAAKDRFVHPRFVQVAALSLAVNAQSSRGERARVATLARDLMARVSATSDRSPEAFAAIAADPTWKEKGIRFGRFAQGPDKPLSARVGQAVAQLKAAGDTTGLIEDDLGFYIARFVAEIPAANVSFEQSHDELRDGYYPQWRAQHFLDFAKKTAADHRVEIHTSRLGSMKSPNGS